MFAWVITTSVVMVQIVKLDRTKKRSHRVLICFVRESEEKIYKATSMCHSFESFWSLRKKLPSKTFNGKYSKSSDRVKLVNIFFVSVHYFYKIFSFQILLFFLCNNHWNVNKQKTSIGDELIFFTSMQL